MTCEINVLNVPTNLSAVAQIDTPLVEVVHIPYSVEGVQAGQLFRFIGRTESLKLTKFKNVEVNFF